MEFVVVTHHEKANSCETGLKDMSYTGCSVRHRLHHCHIVAVGILQAALVDLHIYILALMSGISPILGFQYLDIAVLERWTIVVCTVRYSVPEQSHLSLIFFEDLGDKNLFFALFLFCHFFRRCASFFFAGCEPLLIVMSIGSYTVDLATVELTTTIAQQAYDMHMAEIMALPLKKRKKWKARLTDKFGVTTRCVYRDGDIWNKMIFYCER